MLLFWLILLPLLGGLLCWIGENINEQAPRWIALITMGLTLGIALLFWGQGEYTLYKPMGFPQWQAEESYPWITRFGINFHLALDGLSLLMVVLASLLTLFAVLVSWKENHKKLGLFHLCLLWTAAGVIGVFMAIDLFLFFFFWEMMLIPMYFMISVWGHAQNDSKKRFTGATKFFIYTQASGLFLLVAIGAMAFINYRITGEWSFSYESFLQLTQSRTLSFATEYWLMLGFFIAFAVKMPIIPVHKWLIEAHEQAPTAGSIDITGLLLKTSAYGLLRFSLPLFPNASESFAPIAMTLGCIGLFYGAWLAFVQTDMKKLIGYTSVSHMGLVTIALFSGSTLAYQGAIIQMIAHGLSASGLFIICGILYQRLQTRDMREMGGLWGRLQYLPALTLFFAVATLGMPGTGNFIGEFLMFFGSFSKYPIVISIAAFGMVFASIYSLYLIQRIYFGKAKSESPLLALSSLEIGILMTLAVLLIMLGIYPQPILDTSYAAVANIHHFFAAAVNSTMTIGQ